jgi:YD repeat-containing protein
MKLKNRLAHILVVLAVLPLIATVTPAATIVVMQTFDYPYVVGATATMPQKISDQSDTVGSVIDASGTIQGFIFKLRDGHFSNPIVDPNDTGHETQGRGINIKRHVVGEYLNGSDGTYHGYKMIHPDFLPLDVAGALETIPLGINNDEVFVGTVTLSDTTHPAFISSHGVVTTFAVPGAIATFAYQVNASSQIIGYYVDAGGIRHGYTRDSAGNLTFPIDAPGSTETILFGNNDANWGVGRYTDANGMTHGLFFLTPDDIQTFDYPGSTFTSLNGINKLGQVCGYYVDTTDITHGFLGKVNRRGSSKPNINIPGTPVKPVYPSPEMLGIRAPAW